jgi:hypothetical protein
MKVMLSEIQKNLNNRNLNNTLDMKAFLTQHKKEGTLFFKESISDLEDDSLFELYFYLMPNTKSTINAFPIPIQDFQFYKDKKNHFEFMWRYFENYYFIKVESLEYFEQYDYKHPYVGTKYLWYFK